MYKYPPQRLIISLSDTQWFYGVYTFYITCHLWWVSDNCFFLSIDTSRTHSITSCECKIKSEILIFLSKLGRKRKDLRILFCPRVRKKINDTIITILDPDIENINGKYFTRKIKINHRTGFISLIEKRNIIFSSDIIRSRGRRKIKGRFNQCFIWAWNVLSDTWPNMSRDVTRVSRENS